MAQGKMSPGYISSFCMELYLVLQAGIPLADGVEILRDGEQDALARQMFDTMCTGLYQGETLETALDQAQRFPRYMVDMVAMGEQTGRLDQSLKALADYYSRQEQLTQSVTRAVVYPTVLLSVLVLVLGVLIVEVMPMFSDVYAQLGATMTGVAGWILALGIGLKAHWLLALVVVALLVSAVVIWAVQAQKTGQRVLLSKALGRAVAQSKLASVLSMGFHSGLDLDMSMELAEKMTQHPGLQEKVRRCRDLMASGEGFPTAVTQTELFSGLHCRMLGVGVKTGTLDQVMEDIAKRTDQDAQDAIERHVGSVEPTLVVVLSVLVGVVLLAVMLPLVNIMASLG